MIILRNNIKISKRSKVVIERIPKTKVKFNFSTKIIKYAYNYNNGINVLRLNSLLVAIFFEV